MNKIDELSHKAERAAFTVGVDAAMKHLEKDRQKGLMDILDLVKKFVGTTFPDTAYERFRWHIEHPDESKWMKYFNRALDELDPNVIKMTALDLGFEAAFRGTKVMTGARPQAPTQRQSSRENSPSGVHSPVSIPSISLSLLSICPEPLT